MEIINGNGSQREIGPSLGSEVFHVDGTKVWVSWSKFNPEGQEMDDPGKAVIFLPGWPWQAKAKATWDLPKWLASEFGMIAYNVDTLTGNIDSGILRVEAEAIRQFIVSRGVKELTIFGHSEGAVKAANLTSLLEKNNPGIKINGVVLANPMGVYPQPLRELVKNTIIDAAIIAPKQINRSIPHMPQVSVIAELVKSLCQDMKVAKLRYPLMFAQQMREMRRIDPSLAQIKAPVLLLTTDQDFMSDYRKYLPEDEINNRTTPPIPEDLLREQISNSPKWENLPEAEKAKFGSKEEFVEYYMSRHRTRERMAVNNRARREYANEQILPGADNLGILIANKFGSHIGIPVERYEQTAYVVARIFDRLRRQNSRS